MDVELFDPNFNWRSLVGERGTSRVQNALYDVMDVVTDFGRIGIQTETGRLYQPEAYRRQRLAHELSLLEKGRQLVGESPGFITPDMTPNLFATTVTYVPTNEWEPDTSYLDWVVQKRHVDEVEERSEWDAIIQFVLMKEAGQIKYGHFADRQATVRNYEWGAGMHIYRTWFETNKFGIKMNSLAPKFRFEYFDNIASQIYATLTAGVTATIAAPTNVVVSDINAAWYQLARTADTMTGNAAKMPWANANIRVVAAIEAATWLEPARAVSFATATEVLQKRINTTYTTKLTNPYEIYVGIDKWEQNELGTRIPFGVFGSATDIETFSDKVAYRGAWGFNLDPTSWIKLTFVPGAGFFISTPLPVVLVP